MAEMMGPSHRVAGVAAWLAAAPLLDVHGWQYVAGVAVAGMCAHGRLSPDADIYPILGKIIPGGHRGITHWWPWPVLAGAAALAYRPSWAWVVLAVAVAWASHVVTDAVFGRVPVVPRLHRGRRSRWVYAGAGLRTGGGVERWLAVPAMLAGICWIVAGEYQDTWASLASFAQR